MCVSRLGFFGVFASCPPLNCALRFYRKNRLLDRERKIIDTITLTFLSIYPIYTTFVYVADCQIQLSLHPAASCIRQPWCSVSQNIDPPTKKINSHCAPRSKTTSPPPHFPRIVPVSHAQTNHPPTRLGTVLAFPRVRCSFTKYMMRASRVVTHRAFCFPSLLLLQLHGPRPC